MTNIVYFEMSALYTIQKDVRIQQDQINVLFLTLYTVNVIGLCLKRLFDQRVPWES